MKKAFLLTLLSILLLVSCKNKSFTITGDLQGGENKVVWIEELSPKGAIFIDSIHTDSIGHFTYKYTSPYHTLYNIHTSENNYIVLLPNNGENIKINGDWNNLSATYTVFGSDESQLLWQLQEMSNNGNRQLLRLIDTMQKYEVARSKGQIGEATYNAKKEHCDSIYISSFQTQQDFITDFISTNKGSLATIIALYKPFNQRMIIDQRQPYSISYYTQVLEGLEETMPDNPHTIHFAKTVEQLRLAHKRESTMSDNIQQQGQ